jgi:hypothetical protein
MVNPLWGLHGNCELVEHIDGHKIVCVSCAGPVRVLSDFWRNDKSHVDLLCLN